MKKISLIILLFIASQLAMSYESQEKWETHFSYNNTDKVCITKHKIFARANNHIYSISKEDGVVETYTKLDGLSDNQIKDIQYNIEKGCLIIVYSNSNIDIIESDGTIYNVPDLYQKQISVNKTVYQITMDKEYAYLSTGFGIVVVNLDKKEIANTYIIGPDATKVPIYGIAIDEDHIYALSTDYIYKAKKENTNLLDYNNWQENKIPLETTDNCNTLYKFSNSLFTVKSDSIVYMYNNDWKDFYVAPSYANISCTDSKLLISTAKNGLISFNQDITEDFKSKEYALNADYDKYNNNYWIATGDGGAKKVNAEGNVNAYKVSGPARTDSQRLIYTGGRMYLVNGRGSLVSRGTKNPTISYIENHKWENLNPISLGIYNFVDYAFDVTSVIADPKDNSHWYFSTFGEGVFEVKDNKVIALYNTTTTNDQIPAVENNNEHTNYCDGLAVDSYGNIYTATTIESHPISIYSPSNGWKNIIHDADCSNGWAKKYLFTSKFRLLLSVRNTPWIFLWHDNKTPFDPSDDKIKLYPASKWIDKDGKYLSPTYIHDIQEDKNGTLWAGTENGPVLFPKPQKIFDDNDYRCARVKINRNDDSGLADYLLDGETIYAIEVDYGNRKWLGTANSGLYLVSEDGTETLAHFTKENSPLSSNTISDLELNPKTGELFIVTADGVFSYHTDSTEPVKEATKETIYAYPNPVRPEFSGDVVIGGLENNSNVWITDIAGNLVFKGRTVGGSLSWNCKNSKGEDVTGGVYLVLVSNENSDNPNSVATKILVVR